MADEQAGRRGGMAMPFPADAFLGQPRFHLAALIVDELIGQQQVVVKNLETHYKRIPHVSGATILGNGRVALILDIATLVQAR